MEEEYQLTKSNFLDGLQCPLLLYQRVNDPNSIPPPNISARLTMMQGQEVGKAARSRFPGGVLVDRTPWTTIVSRTREVLETGVLAIFEGGFLFDGVMVQPDILEQDPSGYHLIEVKQSSRVKEEHIPDLAIQKHVLINCGFDPLKTSLMHLNSDFRHPDSGELFKIEDVSKPVDEFLERVPGLMEEFVSVLKQPGCPGVRIGPHCRSPHDCPLQPDCWSDIPPLSVLNIPGLRWNKRFDLYDEGIVHVGDLPRQYKLNEAQLRFVQSCNEGKPIIFKDEIAEELAGLEKPLFFMDFETMNWAIPRYCGTRPFQQIPFQWSVHVLDDGRLTHMEYLQNDAEDRRLEFLDTLLEAVGTSGSIVVYNKRFENGILKDLAATFPRYRERIDGVVERVWDQLDMFKRFYSDSRFLGSNSIKNVLPVLVPDLRYDSLTGVHEGTEAQAAFVEMVRTIDDDRKAQLRSQLLDYCKLDTLAMVEIHRVLADISKG